MMILGFGLFACVALSLLMKQAFTLNEDKQVPPVVRELTEIFGDRLKKPPEFEVRAKAGASAGRKVGVLTIEPKLAIAGRDLALNLGRYVWGMPSEDLDFEILEVVVLRGQAGGDQVFRIPRSPSAFRAQRLRRIDPGKKSAKRSGQPTPGSGGRPKASARSQVPAQPKAPTPKPRCPSTRARRTAGLPLGHRLANRAASDDAVRLVGRVVLGDDPPIVAHPDHRERDPTLLGDLATARVDLGHRVLGRHQGELVLEDLEPQILQIHAEGVQVAEVLVEGLFVGTPALVCATSGVQVQEALVGPEV